MNAEQKKQQSRIKQFWTKIEKEVGTLDFTIKKMFIKLGFNSILAFKGQFARDMTEDDFCAYLEKSIQNLPDDSELLTLLEVNPGMKKDFCFFPGHTNTIIGFMQAMKEIVERNEPLPETRNPHLETSRNSLTSLNAATYLQKILISRLKDVVAPDINLILVQSRTSAFPFHFKIRCFFCTEVFTLTISKDNRNGLHNVRATKFTNHVKQCVQPHTQPTT